MPKQYVTYVAENVVDNKEDVYAITDWCTERLSKEFDIDAKDMPDMVIAIFSVTFRKFVDALAERARKNYDHFMIIVANRLELGFDNATSEEYEKNGGFMFYMKHRYFKSADDERDADMDEMNTVQLCTRWNSINVASDTEIIREVTSAAIKELRAMGIMLESNECIIPIFITMYESIVGYVIANRGKEFEYAINFASLFDVRATESADETEDIITFQPAIEFKLELKSDALASSKFDE